MSLPLALSTSGSDARPISPFVLPTKRARELCGEHDLDFTTRDSRRKQLKIEIPPFNSTTSRRSACSTATSIKESPSSLFSVESEPNPLFDDITLSTGLSIPQSQFATTWASATSPPIQSPNGADNINSLQNLQPALLTAPPMLGLYFTPSLSLPFEIAEAVVDFCFKTYFHKPNVNQVMLFGRGPSTESSADAANSCTMPNNNVPLNGPVLSRQTNDCTSTWNDNSNRNTTGLPTILFDLLSILSTHLKPLLPEKTYALLFPPTPTQARQAIINLYNPGEGISPHVDLLRRYGDGIIGVSFGSGCVMRFDRVLANDAGVSLAKRPTQHTNDDNPPPERNRWELYLPERSVLVLTEEARYDWTHGIDKRTRDYVARFGADLNLGAVESEGGETGRWIERGVRLSVTFRWLLPGADIVGPSPSET